MYKLLTPDHMSPFVVEGWRVRYSDTRPVSGKQGTPVFVYGTLEEAMGRYEPGLELWEVEAKESEPVTQVCAGSDFGSWWHTDKPMVALDVRVVAARGVRLVRRIQ